MNNSQPLPTELEQEPHDSWVEGRLPPPSAFFSSASYDDLLNRVHGLLEGAEQIALLTAPDGGGKTTLLFRIQSDTPEHWLTCRVDANPMLHPDQLFNRLARCIHLSEKDEELSENIADGFSNLRLQGRLPVVMVDDAELLPISTLMTLLRLHEQRAGDTPVCALLLLAQPNIEHSLATHQLHAMGTARFVRMELPRLTLEDTPEYVRHFLKMEGVEQDLGFSSQQLATLHSESGGLPGKLNDLLIHSLRDAIVPAQDTLLERFLPIVLRIPPLTAIAAGSVLFLLLLTLLFQSQLESLLQSSAPTGGVESKPLLEQKSETTTDEGKQKRLQPLLLPPVAEPLELEPETPPLAVGVDPEQVEPSTIVGPEDAELAAQSRKLEALQPKTRGKQDVADLKPTPTRAETAAHTPAPQEPEHKTVVAPDQPSILPANSIVFKREAWLLKQRPEAYTLQLLAAGSERAVRVFAQQHQLTTDVYYFKSQRNGRPWIALLLGIYDDRKTALTVLNMLPESLREAGAWPRSLGSVQDEIKQVQ